MAAPLTAKGKAVQAQKLQAEIQRKLDTQYALANAGNTTSVVKPGGIKAIVGLTLTANVNTITAKWTASAIKDLTHYEIHVAATSDFTNPTKFNRIQNELNWQEGDPGATYYIRVRAVVGDHNGPWSNTGTNATGTVGTVLLDDGAVTTAILAPNAVTTTKITDSAITLDKITTGAIYNFGTVTGSPTYTLLSSYDEVTGCRVTITTSNTRDVVKISSTLNGTSANITAAPTAAQDIISSRIERGSGASPSSWTVVRTAGDVHVPTNGAGVGTGVDAPDAPGIGIWTYRITAQFTNPDASNPTIVINSFVLSAEKLSA